ncbi:MAG: hypothetical protein IIC67_02790 [Thaumarchaeota archaeon]|nr:hypothetical protein [Nitrososphaerota archaeon]
MTKPLPEYIKNLNRTKRMVLLEFQKLVKDKSKNFHYDIISETRYLDKNKTLAEINHRCVIEWKTLETVRSG